MNTYTIGSGGKKESSGEDKKKKREQTGQKQRWMDIMKCENSKRDTSEWWERNWANMCGTTGNGGEKTRDGEGVRGGGRSAEMWRWAKGGGGGGGEGGRGGGGRGGGGEGGGGEMSPQCSAVSASSAGGAGGVPSPYSPTHTDTHASLYNGCFTLVPERERLRESERETW